MEISESKQKNFEKTEKNEGNIEIKQKETITKGICSIVIESKEGKIIGKGMFLSFPKDLELLYCLKTNEHLINNKSINNNQIIYITLEDDKKTIIKLEKNKRYIESFKCKEFDIIAIEILDEDNISKDYFLNPELAITINNQLINNEINKSKYNIEEKN